MRERERERGARRNDPPVPVPSCGGEIIAARLKIKGTSPFCPMLLRLASLRPVLPSVGTTSRFNPQIPFSPTRKEISVAKRAEEGEFSISDIAPIIIFYFDLKTATNNI